MLSSYSFLVIVNSSVFRYIEMSTPKKMNINYCTLSPSLMYTPQGQIQDFFYWRSSHQLIAVRRANYICWLHNRLFTDADWGFVRLCDECSLGFLLCFLLAGKNISTDFCLKLQRQYHQPESAPGLYIVLFHMPNSYCQSNIRYNAKLSLNSTMTRRCRWFPQESMTLMVMKWLTVWGKYLRYEMIFCQTPML